jgi:hypothetical protein
MLALATQLQDLSPEILAGYVIKLIPGNTGG